MSKFRAVFGKRKMKWTTEDAARFLAQFGTVQTQDDGKWLIVLTAGVEFSLRVIDERWMWSFASFAYRKDGKAVLRDYHKTVRKTVEILWGGKK